MDKVEFGSDSSDEDYIPDGKEEEAVSEVDSDGDPEEPGSDSGEDSGRKSRKRKKGVVKAKKKIRKVENTPEAEETEVKTSLLTEEEKKKNADDLWADFMKDTGFKSKNAEKNSTSGSKTKQPERIEKSETEKQGTAAEKLPSKVKIAHIFEFAGEEVQVEKEVDAGSAEARIFSKETSELSRSKKSGGLTGIGNVLSHLGRKQKISTLEKSKLDWDRFKKDENIEEELQKHNKGKDGYLERQDFLERADLRRFEIEKNIRNVERAKRFNSAI